MSADAEVSNFDITGCFIENCSLLSTLIDNDTCSGAENGSACFDPGCIPDHSFWMIFSQQVMYVIVCVVGLIGNSLVIYVVLRFSKMQTVTNIYIVNLAICDEFFLIGIPFLVNTMSVRSWVFGDAMCKAYMASTGVNQFTSTIFLTIMSADRYIAVCHPISATKMRTPLISKLISCAAWTISAIIMIPIFKYSSVKIGEKGANCNIFWPDTSGGVHGKAFTIYTFVLGFAIPLMLMFIFYVKVIFKLRTVGPKNKSKEKKKSHRKVTNLVLTVITVYVICWLPYWTTQLSLIVSEGSECHSTMVVIIFLLASFLSYSNSAMNPILYAFLSDNFKKSFVKACTCVSGNEVNEALHAENSVYQKKRRGCTEKLRSNREGSERGALLRDGVEASTGITMTSRSNFTLATSLDRESVKNGAQGDQTHDTEDSEQKIAVCSL